MILVAISCTTTGAVIHYTTNGSTPTGASPTYTAAVAVGADTTFKAMGVKAGWRDSAVAMARYRTGIGVGRMKITFSGYARGETLTNFPALVVLNESITNFACGGFLSTNGADLRFADATETTELNCEIEKWDTGGNSYVWVQVPRLTGPDTYIWATWGDPAASDPAPCTTNGMTWEPGYRAVWHMADPGPTTLSDSTTNRNGATQANGVTFRTAGKVDDGTHYDGVDDSCQSSTGFNTITDFTAECWAYIENSSFSGSYGMDALRCVKTKPQFLFRIYHAWDTGDGNNDRLAWRIDGSSGGVAVLDNVTRSARLNQWLHLAGTWQQGSPSGTARFFVNGAEVSNKTATLTLASLTQLCFAYVSYGDQAPMQEGMDEVRVSAKARSANWIWVSYMTASSNSAFGIAK